MLRTAIFGALAALQTTLLYELTTPEERTGYYEKSVPSMTFPAFAGMTAFLVIFRQNFSYNRYHEGRTRVQAMTACLFNAFSLCLSFDKQPGAAAKAAAGDADAERTLRIAADEFRNDLTHGISLMHGVCLQHLRCDWELGNLSVHDENYLPPWDSASTPGFKIALWRYFLPQDRVKSRVQWNRASKVQVIGGVTATERGALHSAAGPQRMVTTRRGTETMIDGVPPLVDPEMAPHAFAGCFNSLWTSDTATIVRGAVERPYKVIFAVMELIRRRTAAGGLDMPAPILSTIWQNLTLGVSNFEHCVYLQDTPFPFPWAQLVVVVLIMWQIIIPFTVVTIHNEALGITLSIVTTWVLWALNEVAREIEDPFVAEPNDIHLSRLQYQFNEMLLAVAASDADGDELGWAAAESKWNAVTQPNGKAAYVPTLSPNVSHFYRGGLGSDQDSTVGILGFERTAVH